MRNCVEICAGAGGQAIGLEKAGFEPMALVEIEPLACDTLRFNRKQWNVIEADIREFSGKPYEGADLLAGGVPCPPFSVAGKQLGGKDERDLFPEALRLVQEIQPKAVMLENVRGFLGSVFEDYRSCLKEQFRELGYEVDWRLLNASDFGVPQLRPRVVIVALKKDLWKYFSWPETHGKAPPTVGDTLYEHMAADGWPKAMDWAKSANKIAPTIVGGSKKHGGPDLGPTRAKRAWAELNVNGHTIANSAPDVNHEGFPRLTVQMVALLQGFPEYWKFVGRKTPAYRQVGNAFPPPVAEAVAKRISIALDRSEQINTRAA